MSEEKRTALNDLLNAVALATGTRTFYISHQPTEGFVGGIARPATQNPPAPDHEPDSPPTSEPEE